MRARELVLSYVQIGMVSAAIYFAPPQPCDWVDIISGDIPADTETLGLADCINIKPQAGALAHLYQLKKIIIRHTQMSEFPIISEVGSTLTDITMDYNNISAINPDYFSGLNKLEIVNLGRNPYLADLPDVPQFSTVREFYLQQSAYKELVQLSHASNTRKLAFDNNVEVTHVDQQDLRFYPLLQTLGLDGNQMQEFPDASLQNTTLSEIRVRNCRQLNSAPVLHMVALRTIDRLDIRDTPKLDIVPTLCHESLGSLTIKVGGSGLKLCDCRNAWLKQAAEAGTNIEGADSSTTCGGLNWYDISTAQLLSVCTEADEEILKQSLFRLMPIDRPCAFPIHSIIPGLAITTCVSRCTQSPGCLSVSFRHAGETGDCVIHAPPHNAHLTLPSYETGWLYVGQMKV